MSRKIPVPVMAVISDVIGGRYTHAQIDNMMEAAGIEPETPPGGNRQGKGRTRLPWCKQNSCDPPNTFGKKINEIIEGQRTSTQWGVEKIWAHWERGRKG